MATQNSDKWGAKGSSDASFALFCRVHPDLIFALGFGERLLPLAVLQSKNMLRYF
jgi:hypothetical protein